MSPDARAALAYVQRRETEVFEKIRAYETAIALLREEALVLSFARDGLTDED